MRPKTSLHLESELAEPLLPSPPLKLPSYFSWGGTAGRRLLNLLSAVRDYQFSHGEAQPGAEVCLSLGLRSWQRGVAAAPAGFRSSDHSARGTQDESPAGGTCYKPS